VKCSFCDKNHDQVTCLIREKDIYICDECVMLCMEVVMKQYRAVSKENDELRNIIHLAETL